MEWFFVQKVWLLILKVDGSILTLFLVNSNFVKVKRMLQDVSVSLVQNLKKTS